MTGLELLRARNRYCRREAEGVNVARLRTLAATVVVPLVLVLSALVGRVALANRRRLSTFMVRVVPIYHGSVDRRAVALTFDDGPDPRFTPDILRILRAHHVHATFFVVGENVRRWPGLVRAEVTAGDEVENHTLTHPQLNLLPLDRVEREIDRCDNAIAVATGLSTSYVRPPHERLSWAVLHGAELLGKRVVLAGLGFEHHDAPTSEAMVARALHYLHPGLIILAHDGRLDRHLTVEALPELLQGLEARGYRVVTLHEMLDTPSMNREPPPRSSAAGHSS